MNSTNVKIDEQINNTTIEYSSDDHLGKYYIDNSLVATLDFSSDNLWVDDETKDGMSENEIEEIYAEMTEYRDEEI